MASAADAITAAHVQGLHAFIALQKENAMTTIITTAVATAHIQGFHAFMVAEAIAYSTDDQLEAVAARHQTINPNATHEWCKSR